VFKSTSIFRTIISGVLLAELISVLLMSVTSVFYERHTHFRAFDVMLHGRAESLIGAVGEADDNNDNLVLDERNITIPEGDLFEVQDADGRRLGRSPAWPEEITAETVRSGSRNGAYHAVTNKTDYRFVRNDAVRIIDPGAKNGGVLRKITVLYGSPTSNVWSGIREGARFYSIFSLLLLSATAVLIAWFLRRALSPLNELTSEAASISVGQWSFNPPEAARATRELAPLTGAIEATLVRLEQSFVQQRRLVSDAAHELKTDVAIIKSSLQLLTMKKRSPQDYRDGLEVSLDDCARLENTVVKMLTLARVEYESSHHISFPNETVDLAKCVEENIRRFSSLAELRGISVRFAKCEAINVSIKEEEGALLASNLLHNALQHCPPGAAVSINLSTGDDGFITMSVEDEGEGIPEEVLNKVFEPFFRVDSSRDRMRGGTGLGLAICKAICDRAGGEIQVTSKINVGTRVILRLPSRVHAEV
jgi:signal transduction histidine kinase